VRIICKLRHLHLCYYKFTEFSDGPIFFICFSAERTCRFVGNACKFRPEWRLHGVTSQITYALWTLTGWFPNYSIIPPLCTVRCVVSWTHSSFRLVTSYSNSRSADASHPNKETKSKHHIYRWHTCTRTAHKC